MRAECPPLIQYWHSSDLPDYILELVDTFSERNPGMPHLLFHRETAAELIAAHFGERHLSAFHSCAVPAMQADYFRYCAVHSLGGVYADADFRCVGCLSPMLDGPGNLFQGRKGPIRNGLFAIRSRAHPLLAMAIEIATTNIENRWGNHVGFTTGPLVFTALYRVWKAGSPAQLRGALPPAFHESRLATTVERAIDMYGPIERAFDGVRVSTHEDSTAFVMAPGRRNLPYKAGAQHWTNWRGSIYLSPTLPENEAAG